MHRLESMFSHIADWEEFYAAFRKKDHDSITKFACLVHKVKDVPGDDSSLVFTLAKAALHHQEILTGSRGQRLLYRITQ